MAESESNLERDNVTGKNHEGPNFNTPIKVLTASSIIGDEVENLQGEKLGFIQDIMLNLQKGNIEYVVLSFGGFLGIGDKLFAIPFKALQLNPSKKVFILNKEKEYLEKSPGFDQTQWPETNSHYFEQISNYWGKYSYPAMGTIGPDTNINIVP